MCLDDDFIIGYLQHGFVRIQRQLPSKSELERMEMRDICYFCTSLQQYIAVLFTVSNIVQTRRLHSPVIEENIHPSIF